jgi:LuxR family maltose regulon positive regulatory protein
MTVLPGFRFVETKLRPPLQRGHVVVRQRLVYVLEREVMSTPLTLVSAPAGYGKTTLLIALQRWSKPAWLALDEDDNDPAVFAAALLEAVRRADPRLGAEALRVLPETSGGARVVFDLLINDVVALRDEPLIVVLDDFHRVTETSIARTIEYLIERMPPQMHLVIGTRVDPQLPLPRLRLRKQIAEIRMDALRFNEGESRTLLNDRLHLNLSPSQLAVLHSRTEGWPAGLSLLAGALERMPEALDRDQFLGHLMHLDRYVFEFLAAEVLDALSDDDRQFLLDVSVLFELQPDVAEAVTGREDAGRRLQDLYARNLFVVAVDQPPTTFRFHDLFRDFLLHRLQREDPSRMRALHLRAAAAERVYSRRVAHLIAAEAWNEAAQAIADRGEVTLREGALATLSSWIAALPDDVVDAHPRLRFLLGLAAWTRFDLGSTIEQLSRAVDGFRTHDPSGVGPALVILSGAHVAIGDFTSAHKLTEEATRHELPMASRLSLLIQEAWFDMANGEQARAIECFDAALDLVEARGEPVFVHSLARAAHCMLFGLRGITPRIERFARIAEPFTRRSANGLHATTLAILAWAQQWRGRTDEALATAAEAMDIAEKLGGIRSVFVEAALLRATLAALRRDDRMADAMLDRIFDEMRRPDMAAFAQAWNGGYLAALARIRMLQGRLEEARAAEQRVRAAENLREWPIAPLARAVTRGVLYGDAALLRQAVEMQKTLRAPYFVGDARVALANLTGDEAVLRDFLAEHEEDGTPGAIAWEQPLAPVVRQAQFVAPTGEPLTAREVEVLRLLADGASNAGISGTLGISVHTVKRHVANVLQKLGAASRSEAGAIARRIGV